MRNSFTLRSNTLLSQDCRQKLTKEEINRLPVKKWGGPVHVIRNDMQANMAIGLLSEETVLGFDTETKPVFRKGVSHLPSLLQLAGENSVHIFQLNHMRQFSPLASLLANADILKVGVGLAYDTEQLQRIFSFQPAQFVDLGEIARQRGLESHGLRSMAALFFGIRISKRAQCSNWESPDLKPFQITYAATDAWVSREIYLIMRENGIFS